MNRMYTSIAALAAAAALLAAPGLSAENSLAVRDAMTASANDDYITKDYDFKGFTKLDIGGRFDVIFTKSSTYKIHLTIPTEGENLISVRIEEGTLKIGWNRNFTARLQKKLSDMKFTAEISMPELRSLELGGASTFESSDKLNPSGGEFSLDISGASKVKSLKLNARELDAEVSGAAFCDLSGKFEKVELEVSGAGGGNFDIDAEYLEADISGAARVDIDGRFGNVSADISGASGATLTGSAERLSADVSGASKLSAKGLEAKDVTVEASGASKCTVYATRSLTVEGASGASSVRYKAPENVNPTIRTSSVQRID